MWYRRASTKRLRANQWAKHSKFYVLRSNFMRLNWTTSHNRGETTDCPRAMNRYVSVLRKCLERATRGHSIQIYFSWFQCFVSYQKSGFRRNLVVLDAFCSSFLLNVWRIHSLGWLRSRCLSQTMSKIVHYLGIHEHFLWPWLYFHIHSFIQIQSRSASNKCTLYLCDRDLHDSNRLSYQINS